MGAYSYIGLKNGTPDIIGIPFDPDGQMCGRSPGYEDYPYIYFANPLVKEGEIPTVCLKECPNYLDN